jgi:F-type H+-transporting ATPase subunit gamma
MAKTQDLRRRIRSVRNTMQLTRAMKMVSAAKLRRAQEQIWRSRPYSERTRAVLRAVTSRADPEAHPLLEVHEGRRTELIVVTADKGLCGVFNAGILRHAEGFASTLGQAEFTIAAVGRKGRDHFRRRGHALERQWTDVFRKVEFSVAAAIARTAIERYVAHEVDRIWLVYNEFKSAIQAKPVVQPLLPVPPAEMEGDGPPEAYLYEPAPEELLATLLPHYVEIQVYHALLESVAAEHAARMTAMDNATNNAGELIDALTLTMNRVRQASITTEIIEVVSGAQALGGR